MYRLVGPNSAVLADPAAVHGELSELQEVNTIVQSVMRLAVGCLPVTYVYMSA